MAGSQPQQEKTMTDITKLAEQITSLTDAQAHDLLASIEALTARAQAHKLALAVAEAQRDAAVAKCVCGCGMPAAYAKWADWSGGKIRPCITPDNRGGLDCENDGAQDRPGKYADREQYERDLWVSCDRNECEHGWTRITNGLDLIIDWV